MASDLKIGLARPAKRGISETFIDAHARGLPGGVAVIDPPRLRFPFRSLNRSRYFERQLCRHRIDVVLAEYGTTGAIIQSACVRQRVPLVVCFHGFDLTNENIVRKYRAGYEDLFCSAKRLVAVSHSLAQVLIELGAPKEKVVVCPCGVDTELFRYHDAALAPPVFLSVGRFVEKKGHAYVLQAFRVVLSRYPECRLRFVGAGPLLKDCKRMARRLEIEQAVTFLGERPHQQVAKEMAQARALIHPSLRARNGDCEGMPVVLLEAHASGLPVLATYHGGIPEVVLSQKTGFLCEEQDVTALARHWMKFIENPKLATDFGKCARQLAVEKYSLRMTNEVLFQVLVESARTS